MEAVVGDGWVGRGEVVGAVVFGLLAGFAFGLCLDCGISLRRVRNERRLVKNPSQVCLSRVRF